MENHSNPGFYKTKGDNFTNHAGAREPKPDFMKSYEERIRANIAKNRGAVNKNLLSNKDLMDLHGDYYDDFEETHRIADQLIAEDDGTDPLLRLLRNYKAKWHPKDPQHAPNLCTGVCPHVFEDVDPLEELQERMRREFRANLK